jgi:hypothetical protein
MKTENDKRKGRLKKPKHAVKIAHPGAGAGRFIP